MEISSLIFILLSYPNNYRYRPKGGYRSSVSHSILMSVARVDVTVVVGYVTLRTMFRVIGRGRLYIFSYYCWVMGLLKILIGTLILLTRPNDRLHLYLSLKHN